MLIAVTVMPIIFDMLTDVPEGVPAHGAPLSALATILAICAVAVKAKGALRLWAPVIGVVTGSVVAGMFGLYDITRIADASWVGVPAGGWPGLDLGFGPAFWALLPAFVFVTLVGAIETIGDSVAIQRVSWRKPWAVDFRAVQGDVANEIAIASTVERELGKPGFVLPVVLDDLQRSDFPDELVRRLSIDFSRDWADGLIDVVRALEETQTPRSENGKDAATAAWRAFRVRGSALPTDGPDILYSNWFKLETASSLTSASRGSYRGRTLRGRSSASKARRTASKDSSISFADARALMRPKHRAFSSEHAYDVDLDELLGRATKGRCAANLQPATREIS